MSKGIFQSGSLASCEKQSDVFHHIRYAHSPRRAIPHKSIEIPKSLLTLKDHEEAKAKLEKKLQNEGFGTSQQIVKILAKTVKSFLFILIYIPYYFILQLPMTLISLALGFTNALVRRLLQSIAQMFSKIGQFTRKWKFNFGFGRVMSLLPFLKFKNAGKDTPKQADKSEVIDAITFEKELQEKETLRKNSRFWNKWSLPALKLPKLHLKWSHPFKDFQFKKITLKLPKFTWEWKKWIAKIPTWKINRFSWTFPKIKWTRQWNFSFKLFSKPKLSLPKMSLDQIKKYFGRFREKRAFKGVHWNFKSQIERLKSKFQWFNRKKESKSYDVRKKFKVAVGTVGEQLAEFLDGHVSKLPALPRDALRSIGRMIAWVITGVFDKINRVVNFIYKAVVKVFSRLIKVQENLQKMSALSERARLKSKAFIHKGADAVAKPVVQSIEAIHSAVIPVRLKIRRWTFLGAIVVELSLLFLSEAIMKFQDWNEAHWISRLKHSID